MPWCPKCKNEYKAGVKICSDCGCELVEEETGLVPVTFGSGEEMEELASFLAFSGIKSAQVAHDEKEDVYELSVNAKDAAQANKLSAVFTLQKQKEAREEKTEEEQQAAVAAPYEDSAAKAEDNKSSAYTLHIVGVVGMIVIILGLAGALPIHLSGTSKYMTYGIMSVLFLLFIVMGVISMKSYHIFAKRAASENSLKDTMEKWCLENLSPEELDAELFSEETEKDGLPEEEKYFQRVKLLKKKISEKFMNLDEAFLDRFTDEIYGDIFED